MDPKVKNFFKFVFGVLVGPLLIITAYVKYIGVDDYFRLLGQIVLILAIWRISLHVYRRKILQPKKPLEYGKWAIVTGSTSGIGKEYAEYLAKLGMDVLIISRSESKLIEQEEEIKKLRPGVNVRRIAFDFTQTGDKKKEFYAKLDLELQEMHKSGGLGLLINNVGIANEIPKTLIELTDEEVSNMLQCNMDSTVFMTRAVMKYMLERKNGCVVSISSGSGNLPAPYLAVYSATKAFMTQFTRSLKIEWWDSGVDFLAVTPFYVVSNLYKRKSGSLLAPMPIKLVEGTLAQLGKKYIWQGHGYWFHGFIGNFATYYWGTTKRNLKMMKDNRARYEARQKQKQQ